jgi:hypothetical protein
MSRHLEASLPGDKLRVTVLVSHPRLGKYFDAHLLATKAAPGTHARSECSGWGNLIRWGLLGGVRWGAGFRWGGKWG